MLLFFVLPGYYWIWHRKLSFDFNNQIPTSYAVLPADDKNLARRARLSERVQIECIFYDAADPGSRFYHLLHTELEEALA